MTHIVTDLWDNSAGQKLFDGVLALCAGSTPGHIAEFGTMSGRTSEVLAFAIKHSEHIFMYHNIMSKIGERELHLFDSFEGLPEIIDGVDAESPHVVDGVWGRGACRGISAEELRQKVEAHIPASDRIKIFEGWYSDTVNTISSDVEYALVHIDCDLYASTMDALSGLFSRKLIAKGAYLFFDDYNCNRADPKFGERRAWAECIEKFNIQYSDAGEYGILSHKFIVHEYS